MPSFPRIHVDWLYRVQKSHLVGLTGPQIPDLMESYCMRIILIHTYLAERYLTNEFTLTHRQTKREKGGVGGGQAWATFEG